MLKYQGRTFHYPGRKYPRMNVNPMNFTDAGSVSLSHRGFNKERKAEHKPGQFQDAGNADTVTINGKKDRSKAGSGDEGQPSGDTTTITLISTNDMHGQFKNMPAMAGVIQQLKKDNPHALVVDVGDIAYNPDFSDANHFDPMVDIMNQIGYNVVEPGNHEFQYGAPAMHDEYTSRIKADVVCSNVRDPRTNDYLAGTKPYVIKDIDDVKVAFIGTVVPHMSTSAHPTVGKDVKALDIDDTVKQLIPEIKAKGVDVIVDLSHHGIGKNADRSLAENVEGIDVILSGHDHRLTTEPIVISTFPSKTYIVEGMSHGKYVMKTSIEVDRKNHQVISVKMKPYPTTSTTVKADPAVADIIQNYHEKSGQNR
jgi:5'-nucleotidase / UDP-sugar diphosphatase